MFIHSVGPAEVHTLCQMPCLEIGMKKILKSCVYREHVYVVVDGKNTGAGQVVGPN